MRRPLIPGAILAESTLTLTLTLAPTALAGATGQPNQSCQTVEANGGTTPGSQAPNGGAAFSPGSPLNEPGIDSVNGGTGGPGYSAGNAHSPNPNALSQYDVACFQVSSHH